MNRHRASLLAGFVAVALMAFAAGAVAQERFGNITAAQEHLNTAFRFLERAPERFGGHKGAAMEDIRAAQGELQAAIRDFH